MLIFTFVIYFCKPRLHLCSGHVPGQTRHRIHNSECAQQDINLSMRYFSVLPDHSLPISTQNKVSPSHFFCHGIEFLSDIIIIISLHARFPPPKTPKLHRISFILCFCRSYALCQRSPDNESQPLASPTLTSNCTVSISLHGELIDLRNYLH